MDEKEKLRLRQQEDLKFNLACISVVIATIFELLMLQVKSKYINYVSTAESVAMVDTIAVLLKGARIIAPIGIAVGVIWIIKALKTNQKNQIPVWIVVVSAILGCCSHGTLVFGGTGVDILLLVIPAWAALALVYFLYQVEFFWASYLASLGGIGLWLIRTLKNTGGLSLQGGTPTASELTFYVLLGLTIISVVVLAFVSIKAFKNGGKLTLGAMEFTFFEDKVSCALVLSSGVLAISAQLVALMLHGMLAQYVVYGLLYTMMAWLFGLLVYFTVKML